MKRRSFILGLGVLPFASLAAEPEGGMEKNEFKPWVSVNVRQDRQSVIEFFSFTCSFCRQLDQGFADWGATLPKLVRFEKMPYVREAADQIPAYAFYAAKITNSALLQKFMANAFALIQDQGKNYSAAQTYKEAAKLAGYDMQRYERALFIPELRSMVQRAADASVDYKIEYTPSLGIGGRFLIHSGHTNGDYSQLLQLANGLVSRMIEKG